MKRKRKRKEQVSRPSYQKFSKKSPSLPSQTVEESDAEYDPVLDIIFSPAYMKRKKIVRTRSGRLAELLSLAVDEKESIGVLAYANSGGREIRRQHSFSEEHSCVEKKKRNSHVRTNSGRLASFLLTAEDAKESVCLLEYEDGERVMRSQQSFISLSPGQIAEEGRRVTQAPYCPYSDGEETDDEGGLSEASNSGRKGSSKPKSNKHKSDGAMDDSESENDVLVKRLGPMTSMGGGSALQHQNITPETVSASMGFTSVETSEKLSGDDDPGGLSDFEDIFEPRDFDSPEPESDDRLGWLGPAEVQEVFGVSLRTIKRHPRKSFCGSNAFPILAKLQAKFRKS